jgi:RNAse (barnase) inhibitor barstar
MQNPVIYIDGKNCLTKTTLFDTFKNALPFPDYFTNNWDSFEEIINDLTFVGPIPIILIVNYKLLLESDKKDKAIFKDIIKSSNEQNEYRIFRQV